MNTGLVIKLENIQSIEEFTFKFPKYGVVEFTGDNNHGKSILMKVIKAITSLSIYKDVKRQALIRHGCQEGSVFMSNGHMILGFKLNLDRQSCRFFYRNIDEKDFVQRTFADKEDMIKQLALFGFSVFGKDRLCLQIHEINGIIPFSNNSNPKIDAEIIESITKDEFAEQCLENYKMITEPAFKSNYNQARAREMALRNSLESLALYDVSNYKSFIAEINDVLDSADLYEFQLDKLKIEKLVNIQEFILPHLDFVPIITAFILNKIALPMIVVNEFKLDKLDKHIKALKEVGEHICPTCGQVIE